MIHLKEISGRYSVNTWSCYIIWLASYWIGAIIIVVIFLDDWILCNIGSKYEIVLPVPVGAVTIILRFYIKDGITWVWTHVGLRKPSSYNPFTNYVFMLYFLSQIFNYFIILVKLLRAGGQSKPCIFIWLFFKNYKFWLALFVLNF